MLALKKFSFWQEDWALGYVSVRFWDFPGFSQFPKIISLQSFGSSWCNSYMSCLLLIITLCFTCGERKIWSNIKWSRNIMIMIEFSWKLFAQCYCPKSYEKSSVSWRPWQWLTTAGASLRWNQDDSSVTDKFIHTLLVYNFFSKPSKLNFPIQFKVLCCIFTFSYIMKKLMLLNTVPT